MKAAVLIKRILKVLLPPLLILFLVYMMRGGKDILEGIYIVFPITYIITGVICFEFVKELFPALILSSIAFVIPINVWYNMGTCIDLLLIYFALGCVSYFVKRLVKNRSDKKT